MADEDDNKYGMDFRIWKGDNNKAGQSGNTEPPRTPKQRPQDPPLPPAQPKPKNLNSLKAK